MAIKKLKSVAVRAKVQLKNYQEGKSKPIVTGRPWLDDIFGGLLPMEIVTIAGMSGGGKSFELQKIKNFVMDKENNPNADNFVWLSNSLEMKFISNIIRDLNMKLNKTKKKILTEKFTDEEAKLANDYFNNTTDERFYINEESVTPTQFETEVSEFLEQHKDADAVFIDLDHIALQRDKNGNKKATVDEIVESVNRMKKQYPNSYWIVLSQLNRNILERIRDKDIMAMPNRGDVFQSDSMFFISDYLYVCHNPYRLGINQFSRVNVEAYDYLSEYFTEEKKGKASFETLGNIFYIVLKMREADVMYKDIYIESIEIKDKEKYREPKEDDEVSEFKFVPKPIDRSEGKPLIDVSIFDIQKPPSIGDDIFGSPKSTTPEDDDDDAPF